MLDPSVLEALVLGIPVPVTPLSTPAVIYVYTYNSNNT